mgnify:FL=1|jgi:hypothetical protein
MNEMTQDVILCVSNSYEKKYYLNEIFDGLPQRVKDELKILCVLFTEDVGGILELKFNEEGTLELETKADEEDLLYDEIGSVLKIKQIQNTKQELLESLEMFYKVFSMEF